MWFNRPTYNSYTPSGYSYTSNDDLYAGDIALERAAREREAAARRAEHLYLQRMQDAARSPYNSYLSDDGDSVTNQYDPRASSYIVHEGSKRRRVPEQQQQPEPTRQAELSRQREEERVRQSEQHTYQHRRVSFWVEVPDHPGLIADISFQSTSTSTPTSHFSVPISSPGQKPTQLPKYPSPPPPQKPATGEETPEQIRAAMAIQDFYRNRVTRQQALASIAEVSTRFEQLKSTFTPPPRLDYRSATPDDIITIAVSEPFTHASSIPPTEDAEDTTETSKSLAYTPNNKVVLEYIENLNRLVDKLDGIESGGHASVREQRKQMIRNVVAEAQQVDGWIATTWRLAQA